jgi:NitT/TauT family transport system substrate-binding protein
MKSLALAFALLLSSVAHAADPSPVRLALNWKPEPEFGGFYAAEQTGAYGRKGLKVEIIPGGAGQPVPQMVAAGKVEFGIVNADEVLIARARGADLVALFAVYQTYPQGIMVHAAKGFKKLEDVFKSDSTLAIEKGAAYASFLIKKYGSGKLKLVPYSGGVAGFLHDPNLAQQCFVTSEPVAAKKEKGDPQTFMIADSGYNPYTTVVVANGAYVKKNRALVDRMIAATREGWQTYLAQPSATNALMQKLNSSMDLAAFDEIAEIQKPLIETAETRKKGLGTMNVDRWRSLGQQLADLKVIEQAPGAVQLKDALLQK